MLKGGREEDRGPRADETAPGVRLIRDLWNIAPEKTRSDKVVTAVTSDIYCMPDHKNGVPPRQRPTPPRR